MDTESAHCNITMTVAVQHKSTKPLTVDMRLIWPETEPASVVAVDESLDICDTPLSLCQLNKRYCLYEIGSLVALRYGDGAGNTVEENSRASSP